MELIRTIPIRAAAGISVINTAYTNLTSNISTTSTSFTSTGISITLNVGSSGVVVIHVTSAVKIDNAQYLGELRVNRDSGTEYINCGGLEMGSANARGSICKSFIITGLSSGNHTFLIEWQIQTGATILCLPATSPTGYNMSIAGMSW